MASNEVQINYELMDVVRNRFSDRSEQLNQLSQVLESQINELRAGGWIGQGANAFYTEMDEMLIPVMKRLIQAMIDAETSCQTIVTEFKNAEEEAQANVNFTFE